MYNLFTIFSKQYFPNGSAGMSLGDRNKLSSAFPNFKVPSSGSSFDLGYLAYGGMMIGELKQKFGRYEIHCPLYLFRTPDLSQILPTIFNPRNKIITCGTTSNRFKNEKQYRCIKILCTN